MLYALLVYLSILRWYVCRDNQDLTIWDLKHFSQIVRGDGHTSDLKHEAIQRWLTIDLAAMGCGERSMKLLEHTTLASCVFRVLVYGARVIEVAPVVSMIWCLRFRFDLDLALHVARRYASCVPQARRHAG
jgi:hypothetical protein